MNAIGFKYTPSEKARSIGGGARDMRLSFFGDARRGGRVLL